MRKMSWIDCLRRNSGKASSDEALTVYLSPEVLNIVKLLERRFGTRQKRDKFIEMAIKNLYEKNRRKLT